MLIVNGSYNFQQESEDGVCGGVESFAEASDLQRWYFPFVR